MPARSIPFGTAAIEARSPQDLAEPLGGLRGGGDELVGSAHREPLHQPPDPAEGAQVLLPFPGRAPPAQ